MANFTEGVKGLRPSYTSRDKQEFEISDQLTKFFMTSSVEVRHILLFRN